MNTQWSQKIIKGRNQTEKRQLKLVNKHWQIFISELYKSGFQKASVFDEMYEKNKLVYAFHNYIRLYPDSYLHAMEITGVRMNEHNMIFVLWFSFPKPNEDLINLNDKYLVVNLRNRKIVQGDEYFFQEEFGLFNEILTEFSSAFLPIVLESIYCEVVSANSVAKDFPELYEIEHKEKKLSECFYIRLNSKEKFTDGFLVGSSIDNILKKAGSFEKFALNNEGVKEGSDFYFESPDEAEKVIVEIVKETELLGHSCY